MSVERIKLSDGFTISRLIKGGWQLSQGHSENKSSDAVNDMTEFVKQGVTTFDCADIYTGVEELIGEFLKTYKRDGGKLSDIQVLTKFVPDYDVLASLSKAYVEKVIDRSLKRLGLECLDMVQFSWWSYGIEGWIQTALWLEELQRAGKIRLISGTNFNTIHTREIIEAGVRLSTLQVQYSLLDNRPEKELVKLCNATGTYLLCYGTVAGGFLSEHWLGAPEPQPPFDNRSLVKYKLMIDEFGGWTLFQELLMTLKSIADKYHTGIANVASRFILDGEMVAGVIIGARSARHLSANLNTFNFKLDNDDHFSLQSVLQKRVGPPGDVFDIERIKDGPHGKIMRYNLNQVQL